MATKSYSYLDLSVLDEVAPLVLSSRAAVVFDSKMKEVDWANSEGLSLLGVENIRAALEGKADTNSATRRQIEMVAGRVEKDGKASGTLRLKRGFKAALLNFTIEKIVLSGKSTGLLLITDDLSPHQTKSVHATALTAALEGYGNATAVLSDKAEIVAMSSDFDALGISQASLKSLIKEVATEKDQLVKRTIKTKAGLLPSGIARLDDEDGHHLLLIADADEDFLAAQEAAKTSDSVKAAVSKPKKSSVKKAPASPEPDTSTIGKFSNRRDGSGRNSMGRWYFKDREQAEAGGDDQAEAPKKVETQRAAKSTPAKKPTMVKRAKATAVKNTAKTPAPKKAIVKKQKTAKAIVSKPSSQRKEPETKSPESQKNKTIRTEKAETKLENSKPQSTDNSAKASPKSDRVSIVKVARNSGARTAQVVTSKLKAPVTTSSDEPKQTDPNFKFNASERPVRFVWEMNNEKRFTKVSPEFSQTVGPKAASVVDLTWEEVASTFKIANGEDVGKVLDKSGTWSGKTVLWPIEGTDLNVPIDLAGLPSYGRDREFAGFNGFGIIRTADAMIDPDARGMNLDHNDTTQDVTGRLGFLARGKSLSADEKENFDVIGAKLSSDDPSELNATEISEAPDEELSDFTSTEVQVDTSILAKLPIAVLVYRDDQLLFANSEFHDLTGYVSLDDLSEKGGVDALFGAEQGISTAEKGRIFNEEGEALSVKPHLQRVPWDSEKAMLLTLRRSTQTSVGDQRGHNSGEGGSLPRAAVLRPSDDDMLQKMEAAFGDLGVEDLRNILDTATDGIIILSNEGVVQAMNRSAEALFDIESRDVLEQNITRLLAPESQRVALDYVASISGPGVASLLNDGREIIGRTSKGGLLPLFMTVGKLEKTNACCAVLRDITQWKKVEEELVTAKGAAELASAQKSEFLAKVSHEVRTPLNAIIGFSDLMIEERFGKIDNDRYRGYLRDIKASGSHVLDLINDLLDISKIEAGKMDLNFDACDLNTIISETVALMQPNANKERVIIRTSLSAVVPKIVADPRSLKQIILNLVSNSVKYTKSGGQVIVSTVYENSGEVALRVRDTGVGMSEEELARALRPFQQVSGASNAKQKGTGLGLPLTKAMIEANRAEFYIESVPDEGTLVEVHFPVQRVLADR